MIFKIGLLKNLELLAFEARAMALLTCTWSIVAINDSDPIIRNAIKSIGLESPVGGFAFRMIGAE